MTYRQTLRLRRFVADKAGVPMAELTNKDMAKLIGYWTHVVQSNGRHSWASREARGKLGPLCDEYTRRMEGEGAHDKADAAGRRAGAIGPQG